MLEQKWQDSGGTPTVKDHHSYRYDGNSNRLYRNSGDTILISLAYDAWNRMVGVYPDNGGSPWWPKVIYTFKYDGLHRRVGRTAYPGGVPLPGWFFCNASWQAVDAAQRAASLLTCAARERIMAAR